MTINTLAKDVINLAKAGDDHFLDLASRLRELHDLLTDDEGRSNLDAFADCIRRAGISRRKAYYLIEIDQVYGPMKVSRKRLAMTGWTKLGIIAKYVTARNLSHWLETADSCTAEELKAHVASRGTPGRPLTFRLSDTEFDVVVGALLLHGARLAGKGRGATPRLRNKNHALVDIIRSIQSVDKATGR
jgi:hypothetical protein